jgi:hypothetical protein
MSVIGAADDEIEFLPDDLLPVWRSRADRLMGNILETLGPDARRDAEAIRVTVIIAAAAYHQVARLYEAAPTRKKLRENLTALRDALGGAAAILEGADPYVLAALCLFGFPDREAIALKRGDNSPLCNFLAALRDMADAALKVLPLTGAASGQKAWTNAPKRALVLRCMEVFERYRPGEATSTTGGPFQEFVSYVYEVGTGEAIADLETPVKAARRLIREGRAGELLNPIAEAFNPLLKYQSSLNKL